MMDNPMRTIIQQTRHPYLCQLALGFLGLVVHQDWKHRATPQQDLHLHPFAHDIPQDRLYREIVGTPEVNIGLLKALSSESCHEGLLLGTPTRSCTMVFPAYELQVRGHTPVGYVDVLLCLEKMQAEGEHGAASIDEVGDTRSRMDRLIALSPPVLYQLLSLN